MLAEWLSTARKQQLALLEAEPGRWQHRELVFASAEGGALNAPSVRRAHYRYLRELRLPKVKPHELRHTHATRLLGQGADINLAAARLGHATPAFTLSVYGHLLLGADRAAVERLAGHLELEPGPTHACCSAANFGCNRVAVPREPRVGGA